MHGFLLGVVVGIVLFSLAMLYIPFFFFFHRSYKNV